MRGRRARTRIHEGQGERPAWGLCAYFLPCLALGDDGGYASSSRTCILDGGHFNLLSGDGPRIRRGGREILAMCSASFDEVCSLAVIATGECLFSLCRRFSSGPRCGRTVLVATIMLLCNSDRVIMSLTAQYGLSNSFVSSLPFHMWPHLRIEILATSITSVETGCTPLGVT